MVTIIFFSTERGDDDGTTILQKLAAQSGAEINDLDPETGAIRRRRARGTSLKDAKTQQNLEGNILQIRAFMPRPFYRNLSA